MHANPHLHPPTCRGATLRLLLGRKKLRASQCSRVLLVTTALAERLGLARKAPLTFAYEYGLAAEVATAPIAAPEKEDGSSVPFHDRHVTKAGDPARLPQDFGLVPKMRMHAASARAHSRANHMWHANTKGVGTWHSCESVLEEGNRTTATNLSVPAASLDGSAVYPARAFIARPAGQVYLRSSPNMRAFSQQPQVGRQGDGFGGSGEGLRGHLKPAPGWLNPTPGRPHPRVSQLTLYNSANNSTVVKSLKNLL
ncbi:hypothetical protein CERSUDRAFT_76774 [Gelatoporia subvermispora B]|uniref:Uncharacterized protein n=1 Tax=Ceriporiopsis subvermispora (strain B) TaxID=914234 RepID=M2R2F0_CERS8|nr:hypothetical protein CERSUDRAFT_76774 [Gelatoporia subvermispora B]